MFQCLDSVIKLGSPCKINNKIYGRVIGHVKGSSFIKKKDGIAYSHLVFSTPGATIITTGRAYLDFFLNDKDMNKLIEFERHAIEVDEWYNKTYKNDDTMILMSEKDIIPIEKASK